MAKNNWNIHTLENRLIRIESLFENETDPKKIDLLRNDINVLEDYIDEYYDDSHEELMSLLESYEAAKENFGDIPFIWEDIKEFRDITKKDIGFIPEAKRCSLSRGDLLDITHDFYKSLGSFFYGHFMKNFYRRKDHIVFRTLRDDIGYKGQTISLPSIKENFIEVNRDYTLDDVLTTIHEYSHATSSTINPKHILYPKNLYSEIDTILMEIIGADFIEALIKNGQATLIKASKHDEFCCTAENLANVIRLLEYEKKVKGGYTSNKVLKDAARKACSLHPIETEDLLQYPEMNGDIYLTSYIFALELYRMFKEDKEKALYYLRKIIQLECYTEEEYYSNIKRFGFIPNLSLREFHEDCRDDVMRLTRKKKTPKRN